MRKTNNYRNLFVLSRHKGRFINVIIYTMQIYLSTVICIFISLGRSNLLKKGILMQKERNGNMSNLKLRPSQQDVEKYRVQKRVRI